MNKLFVATFLLLALTTSLSAQDITALEKIGAVKSFAKTDKAVTFTCTDDSQVQLTVLAPDLIRVRAAFAKSIPAKDHSWAIAKENWDTPRWSLKDDANSITISTDELEVVVRRAPLLIEFRDAHSHQPINCDEQPMAFDARGILADRAFDAKAGSFVAVSKKLGFDEHFYGLGEKAAHLDKRRDKFVNWNSDTPGYTEGKDPIYQTIPFYLGLQQGVAYGIFFDNSYRSYFDFGNSSQQRAWFGAEGGELNYYFFYVRQSKDPSALYADLTGHMPLRSHVGVRQSAQSRWVTTPSRWSMKCTPVSHARPTAGCRSSGHRLHELLPRFTFDRQRFPNPKALTEAARQTRG
jgi:alpha-glucosidase